MNPAEFTALERRMETLTTVGLGAATIGYCFVIMWKSSLGLGIGVGFFLISLGLMSYSKKFFKRMLKSITDTTEEL